MQIKRLQIDDYLCLVDFDIVFDTVSGGSSTILIGENGAGKSTMIECILNILMSFDTAQQLRGMGLSESTLSFYQNESFRLIIRFFKERGIQCYDYDVMCKYLRFEYSRFQRGEINLKRLRALELGANRFMRVAEGQKLEWRVCSRGTHITLSPTYQTLLEDYLSSLHQAESTISGKAAVVRRYLSYLHLQGRDTPSDWSIGKPGHPCSGSDRPRQ